MKIEKVLLENILRNRISPHFLRLIFYAKVANREKEYEVL